MKTFSEKPADVKRVWHVLDATETTMGRLATVAASLLLGKGKPTVTPHVDGGDYVIVINADKLVVSGNKLADKMYYNHSNYPGGLRERTLDDVMKQDSRIVIEKAVRGMLPVNKLRPGRMQRLKIYTDDQHNHSAQQPVKYDLKGKK